MCWPGKSWWLCFTKIIESTFFFRATIHLRDRNKCSSVRVVNRGGIEFTHALLQKIIYNIIMLQEFQMQTVIYWRMIGCRVIKRSRIIFTHRTSGPRISIIVWWKLSFRFSTWFTQKMRSETAWLVRREMIDFDAKHSTPDHSGKGEGGGLLISTEG